MMSPRPTNAALRRAAAALAALLLLSVALAACDSAGPDAAEQREPPRPLTAQEQQVAASGADFGLTLFRAVSAEEAEGNVFLSPLSVSMALGMTLNGAEGETRAAMEEALELSGLSRHEVNASYRGLIDLLAGLDPAVAFSIANSIWYRESFAVEPAFIDTNRHYFDAEVAALDFNRPEAPATINDWVREKTQGKIEEIVSGPISPLTMMYLVNAVYFKGVWQTPFDERLTEEAPFTRPDGSEQQVDMMTLEDPSLPVYRDSALTAVELPYGDSLYAMTVLLPAEDAGGADALAAGLDAARWQQITGGLRRAKLSALKMPRFTLEYEKKLNDILEALGMEVAFDPDRSNFDGINPDQKDLHISEVMHKTFVEVNEEGTEAAAVTSVEISVTSLPPSVIVDRPFVVVIREQHSGTILFIGKVANPAS